MDSQTLEVDIEAIGSETQILDLLQRGQGDASFTPSFIALLDERHPVYAGVDSATVIRIRGALLRGLAYRALPKPALPFVLEELESAFDPWLTAVAAAALRRYPEPSAQFVHPLLEAILYIRQRDDIVRLDAHGGYGSEGEPTTALKEIFQTFLWLGGQGRKALPRLRELSTDLHTPDLRLALHAAIRALEVDSPPETDSVDDCDPFIRLDKPMPHELTQSRLQDQSGATFLWPEFFQGQPTVVVFFFTRCGNPAKCPLTISKLGRLQQHLRDQDSPVRTAAITYDPEYDSPARLTQYARSWGAHPDEHHRFVRTLDDPAALRAFFELGVNYGSSTVNQHQLEAFVLDHEGSIVGTIKKRRLDAAVILREIAQLTRE